MGSTVSLFHRKPRMLVVEDSLLLADMICELLGDFEIEPVGPVPTVGTALRLARVLDLDGAVMDIRVRDENTFPVCRLLTAQGVPFVFLTGTRRGAIPNEFREVPIVAKPFEAAALLDAVQAMLPATAPLGAFNMPCKPRALSLF